MRLRAVLTEQRLWLLIAALSACAAAGIVALALVISQRVHQVPQVARQSARQEAALIGREAADRRNETNLRATTLGACERSNQLRAALNVQTGVTYKAFIANAELESALTSVNRSQHQKVPQRRANIQQQGAAAIRSAAGGMQYLPPTDCQLSLEHPLSYKLPASITWSKHLQQLHKGG